MAEPRWTSRRSLRSRRASTSRPHDGPDQGAAGGRSGGARSALARRRGRRQGASSRTRSSVSGRSAVCPTTARSRRPARPADRRALRLHRRMAASFPTTGSPGRSATPTIPKATSTRCRAASPISAPGPSSPISRTGWPMPSPGAGGEGGRGCALRCAARAPDEALRRPPHQRADAPAEGEHHARGRDHADRRRAGGGPSCRRLSGFRFTPDAKAEGADAQALRGAAQKALATAIVDRAERLARAGDGEIVLSSTATCAGRASRSRARRRRRRAEAALRHARRRAAHGPPRERSRRGLPLAQQRRSRRC